MPFALVFIGLMLIISGARNTYAAFGTQLLADFTGDKNFTYWVASIGSIGALGYTDELRAFSRWFMLLIIVGFIIHNGGFFDKFMAALKQGPKAPVAPATPQAPSTNTPGNSTPQSQDYGSYNQMDPTGKLNGWATFLLGF